MRKIMYLLLIIGLLPGVLAGNEFGRIEAGRYLLITDVDVKVDGQTNRNLEFGEEIPDEANPSSVLEFDIELRNNNSDLILEDVSLEITIENIDDGDDITEIADETNINPSNEKQFSLDFTLTSDTGEGEYDILIEAEGEVNGTIQRVDYELILVVEDTGEASITLKDIILDLNKTVSRINEESQSYFEPYTECDGNLKAEKEIVKRKDTQIDSLGKFEGLYNTCIVENQAKQERIDALGIERTELLINQTILQAALKKERDSKLYWILGILAAAAGGFYYYKKKMFPESEVQEESGK